MSSNALAPAPSTALLAADARSARASGQYLSFRISAEEYGIDILKVQEIRSYEAPTRVANAPAFVKGVVNLRGVIVPIVDLRLRLGQAAEYSSFTVVIVLNVCNRVVGIVVDSVSDVLELKADEIMAAPEVGSAIDTRFVTGLGKVAERMLILLDIEGMVGSPDFGLID
ncbi:chemotaxis protein CheW [Paucibacter sp. O1-1]|uniref:chemotaxis protein CheW n=1 Tax=Paucibacter sp. M5-1 TaxID=3015998 RepID=UPI0021D4E050|nr:chemotaxis protein CheW [Paucibacter sp. M5-1]MCU7373381.1 chemotaxis protein CheW [Paucibacter sp. O1-1]MCZ7879672.1 chemotaxis protein CheW [Paucibacter sp. M5-1]MDA3828380.1 chemotaxis protein CheW [Paucibacter sp. O1-1]